MHWGHELKRIARLLKAISETTGWPPGPARRKILRPGRELAVCEVGRTRRARGTQAGAQKKAYFSRENVIFLLAERG
jgi:hypothetical protein